jgi:hypothetical protein
MRKQRNERASSPTSPHRTAPNRPASGYALIVDGQAKRDFEGREQAQKAARDLKDRFPRLQVKVYDAVNKQSDEIGFNPA